MKKRAELNQGSDPEGFSPFSPFSPAFETLSRLFAAASRNNGPAIAGTMPRGLSPILESFDSPRQTPEAL